MADLRDIIVIQLAITENFTNGDMIKALFPNEDVITDYGAVYVGVYMRFDKNWWNAPYEDLVDVQDADVIEKTKSRQKEGVRNE